MVDFTDNELIKNTTKIAVEVKSTSPTDCLVRHIPGVFKENVILTHTLSGKSYEFLPGNKRKSHRVGILHATAANAMKSKSVVFEMNLMY